MNLLSIILFFSVVNVITVQASKKISFSKWLNNYKAWAIKRGIPPQIIRQAFRGLTYDPKVIKLDRNQGPGPLETFKELKKTWMSPLKNGLNVIEQGKILLKKNASLLNRIYKKYSVDPEVIIAIWAVETKYGENTGKYSVIRSLASLAYEGRRARYFKKELLAALKIIRDGHIKIEKFKGSWAGAIGHLQFMPSNFFHFAVDFNKDGRKDIWNTKADFLASIANYLHKARYKKGVPIGHFISKKSGNPENKGQIIKLNIKGTKAIWAGKNFAVILRWNRSNIFAAKVMFIANHLSFR